jgi:hypothetical protein
MERKILSVPSRYSPGILLENLESTKEELEQPVTGT